MLRWLGEYHARFSEPAPLGRFTRQWARAGTVHWGTWDDAIAAWQDDGAIVVVWRRVGARLVFTREAWDALAPLDRYRYEHGSIRPRGLVPPEPAPLPFFERSSDS